MSSNPFTLDLLQAINDWQINSTSKRGKKLEKLSSNLPVRFKMLTSPCYRKINLEKGGVFSLLGRTRLDEKISSWSTSVSVAQNFRGGVSRRHLIEQSIILEYSPDSSEIIINLNEVYKSNEFQNAINIYSGQINNISEGINKYGEHQHEVVLKVEYVTHKNVYMIGGRSSSTCISNIDKIRRPLGSQLVYDITKNEVFTIKWLNNEKTKNLVERITQTKNYPYNVFSKHYGYKYKDAVERIKHQWIPLEDGTIFRYSFLVDSYAIYFCLIEHIILKKS